MQSIGHPGSIPAFGPSNLVPLDIQTPPFVLNMTSEQLACGPLFFRLDSGLRNAGRTRQLVDGDRSGGDGVDTEVLIYRSGWNPSI
ncbi:hypothetical protein PRIPAC_74872 [Pristionchus pacificus]|uniref:Uncharacterized protein n=1 Tax=Pristionchus pacificus TaxID=54126 RepID=A0A2A6CRX1_PRIPA|nr:hypothetical protein PRIPAC_74872 [Pristionchus pacificus]|eukprot:PDM80870.1 hypothetical protein PRIPAC_35873 [Pristionchus pacificus]